MCFQKITLYCNGDVEEFSETDVPLQQINAFLVQAALQQQEPAIDVSHIWSAVFEVDWAELNTNAKETTTIAKTIIIPNILFMFFTPLLIL